MKALFDKITAWLLGLHWAMLFLLLLTFFIVVSWLAPSLYLDRQGILFCLVAAGLFTISFSLFPKK